MDQTGSVLGEVVYEGDIPDEGAEITLTMASPAFTQLVTSGEDGHFVFDALPAGSFTVTIVQSGMIDMVRSGELKPGETLTLSPLELKAATVIQQVNVMAPDKVASIQIREEEKQRVLDIVPNFYVSYDQNAAPLPTHLKYQLVFRNFIDPFTLGSIVANTGVEQATNVFPGFGTGASGFGKRLGAGLADFTIGAFLSGAVFPQVFKQDPRYFYNGKGSWWSRTEYAASRAVVCKGDNGKWQPCYSLLVGSLLAAGASNAYYPAADRNGAGLTFENFAIGIGTNAAGNIIQEFLIKHLTPKKHNHGADLQP